MISGAGVRTPPRTDYARIAHDYAEGVATGKIVACKWVRLAGQRHLDDLAAAETAAFPFRFDEAKANSVCKFCELFEHIKGPKAGSKIHLEPWQVFIVASVFGWVRKDTGNRRYRKAYIEVPRGNAKSTLSAVIALYCMAADGESGADVFSAATKREQARIVFDVAQNMARRSAGFRRRLSVRVDANAIVQPKTASIFKPLAAEDGTQDGLNVHLGVVDELHAHKTRGLYDVIETAAAKRLQSLIWIISTAGTNQAGICYEVRTYGTKILEKTFDDDSVFVIIYTIDDGDDWKDPRVWEKANPNWGVSVMPEAFAQLMLKATRTPSAVNNAKTKYLDIWTNADVAWMDMAKWRGGAVAGIRESDFETERCWGGLDLASKIDLAVAVKIFRRLVPSDQEGEGSKPHYYAFLKAWLPEARVRNSPNSQYEGWVREGFIEVTPGNIIDYDEIEAHLKTWPGRFEVASVAYDPYQATGTVTRLMKEGFTMVEVGATVKNLSEPMKELDALVLDGRFHHDGNPLLTWMISNVVAHTDKKENIFPNKQTVQNKIDGPVAIIMALSRALLDEEPEDEWDGNITVIGAAPKVVQTSANEKLLRRRPVLA